MATDAQVLQQLANMISKSSGSFMRTQKPDTPMDNKEDGGAVKKANLDLKQTTAALPKKLKEAFDRSGSAFVKNMAGSIKKMEDVMKADEQKKAMVDIINRLNAVGARTYKSQASLDKELESLGSIANNAGLTLEQLGIQGEKNVNVSKLGIKTNTFAIANHEKVTEELTQTTQDLDDAMIDASAETKKHTVMVDKSKQALKEFSSSLKRYAKEAFQKAEQEMRFAQQTAVADAGWIKGLTLMGISQIEYMKILKDTRTVNLAANSENVNFKQSLIETQHSLRGFTTDFNEAARVSGMFHKNMSMIGVSQGQLGDAVLQQTKIYKENFRALGVTAEEFANLSHDLINDQGMRDVLLTLKEKERKAYVLGIQQRQAEFRSMGFTIERAKALQKTFQGLVGMDPKERMKKAAKKRAMLGSLGMGAEAEELFKLETTYRTLNAEQKAQADIRMAEIQAQGSKIFGEMSGSGTSLGQSMAMQLMAQKTGFDEVVRATETVSGEGIKFDQILLGKTNEINENIKDGLGLLSYWAAATHSALGSLGTNLITGIGGIVAGAIAMKAAGGLLGKGKGGLLGKLGGAGAGALGGIKAAGMMALPALAVGAAGAAGYGAGSLISNNLSDNANANIGDVVGATVDNVLGFFGNDEANKRLAALATYEATLVNKINEPNMAEKNARESMTPEARAAFNKKEQDATAMQAAASLQTAKTMQELTTYLKSSKPQNEEQIKTMNMLATATLETMRWNQMVNARRMGGSS